MPRETAYDRGWREASEHWTQIGLKSAGPDHDGSYALSLSASEEVLTVLVDSLCQILDSKQAPNYVEIEAARAGKRFTVLVQRADGKTPHQLRAEADSRLAQVREAVETCGDRAAIIAMRTALGDI